jgi:hypothetical protein
MNNMLNFRIIDAIKSCPKISKYNFNISGACDVMNGADYPTSCMYMSDHSSSYT